MEDERILKGMIPWTRKEFDLINRYLFELLKKPKDDWSMQIHEPAGLGLGPFHPMSQVYDYFSKQYKNTVLFNAHFVRYNKIISFLQAHEMRMKEEGFMVKKSGVPMIKDELLDVLCFASYSAVGEDDQPAFNCDEIVKFTKQKISGKNPFRDHS
ncbi:MAG: hypothetical protein HQL25_00465 [Candidatus Omnitrophica bacterium]|nr:hypothetical protein [Candidatus Omnitrophota bacterium]